MSGSYADRVVAGLPDFPEEYEGDDAVDLVLFFRFGSPVVLATVSKADAKAYCKLQGTKSPDGTAPSGQWFAGFRDA